ncbi:hypothetical protein COU56_00555 [Candidatus Pacearchaeota archaeon CG10_big_fil_rev_8_21_14_0_10_31_9]|nr:MAG: hypothetical protein AUJ62_00590 [Candidatus Pacearchaeota archaeon CG1_02_32_21]PIN95909.1 MAG: hypothetical protein COU56_00555 [Candidatus Pacearchaeota archaeon CG10_big_fil_rev_8_21_14_0_10_31_9]PIZ83701.1 MAG: hypothetical protein COX97_00745 [Candidatus Pacearchaeota archaeon CG_4_10_14_0_2_um_filter_05_32_18]
MKDGESLKIDRSLKVIVSASFIILLTTFISKILTYLYRIVIARYYGVEIYGVYSISLMVIGWVTVFAGLGFAGGLTRYLSYHRGKNEEYKSSYLVKKTTFFLIISGIIGCLIIILTSSFIANQIFHIAELQTFLIIFSLSIPFSVLAGIFFSILRSYEKIGWFAFIVNILQNSVKLLALVFLIYLGFSSKSIAVSHVAGVAIALVVAYIISRKKIPFIFKEQKVKDAHSTMMQLVSYSWPLIFFGFIASILSWTDTFMIGVLRTTTEVGFYNAAVPIAVIINISADLFKQMFLPIITKEYGKGNIATVKVITRQVTKWLFVISIPLFIAIFLFPQEAIRILFGEQYLPASNSLRILAVGFFIASILDVSQEVLSMKGRSKLILMDTIVIAVVNIILNYILIPIYGISGAAFSTTFSISALSILFTYQVRKSSSIFIIKRDVIKVLFSGIVAFLLTWFSFLYITEEIPRLIVGGILFVLTYFLLIYLTHSIDKNDYMILRAIKGKLTKMSQIQTGVPD